MSQDWKNIKIDGIVKIEKCVAEFKICEMNYSPYGKFKLKIFESADGKFTGLSNQQVKDESGKINRVVGHGATLEETLTDTLQYFFKLVSWKGNREWKEEDFAEIDPFDF
jgi:hypothetical protein